MANNVDALWDITLHASCPHCNEEIDLFDQCSDLITEGLLEVVEHNTERTRDVTMECTECHKEFVVDFDY